jgi:hypothetical protein
VKIGEMGQRLASIQNISGPQGPAGRAVVV